MGELKANGIMYIAVKRSRATSINGEKRKRERIRKESVSKTTTKNSLNTLKIEVLISGNIRLIEYINT